MKRLKNIEGKNKELLDAIEKQKKNKPEITEKKDKIEYLEDKIYELFEMYSNSFNKESKTLLKTLARNENKVNYQNLPYRILLLDGKFQEISFLKKYGTLYNLLEDIFL